MSNNHKKNKPYLKLCNSHLGLMHELCNTRTIVKNLGLFL